MSEKWKSPIALRGILIVRTQFFGLFDPPLYVRMYHAFSYTPLMRTQGRSPPKKQTPSNYRYFSKTPVKFLKMVLRPFNFCSMGNG